MKFVITSTIMLDVKFNIYVVLRVMCYLEHKGLLKSFAYSQLLNINEISAVIFSNFIRVKHVVNMFFEYKDVYNIHPMCQLVTMDKTHSSASTVNLNSLSGIRK